MSAFDFPVIQGTVIMVAFMVTQVQTSWSFAQDGQEWKRDFSMIRNKGIYVSMKAKINPRKIERAIDVPLAKINM